MNGRPRTSTLNQTFPPVSPVSVSQSVSLCQDQRREHSSKRAQKVENKGCWLRRFQLPSRFDQNCAFLSSPLLSSPLLSSPLLSSPLLSSPLLSSPLLSSPLLSSPLLSSPLLSSPLLSSPLLSSPFLSSPLLSSPLLSSPLLSSLLIIHPLPGCDNSAWQIGRNLGSISSDIKDQTLR